MNSKNSLLLDKKTVATLLLFSKQVRDIRRLSRRWRCSQGSVIRRLVSRRSGLKTGLRQTRAARTQYQRTGAGYIRYNVKLQEETWALIQLTARGYGVSACAVVAALLPAVGPTTAWRRIATLTVKVVMSLRNQRLTRRLEIARAHKVIEKHRRRW